MDGFTARLRVDVGMRTLWLMALFSALVACSGGVIPHVIEVEVSKPDAPAAPSAPLAPEAPASSKEPEPANPVNEADAGSDGGLGPDSGANSEGGSSGQDSGSSEAGNPGCTEGALRCSGATAEECTGGQWQVKTACPYVCSNGACSGLCTPGTSRCNGLSAESCSAQGQWVQVTMCQNTCSNGACGGGCTPGVKRCTGLNTETCSAQGEWAVTYTCPFVCSNGSCSGVCSPGAQRCTGLNAETCSAQGQWATISTCPYACSAGSCTGVCTPGSKRCNNNGVETCSAMGQWTATETCSYLCSSGTCVGSCNPGATRCSGLTVETCSAGGTWQTSATCPYVCSAGACTGVCSPGSTSCSAGSTTTCSASGTWNAPSSCPARGNATSTCSGNACGFTCQSNYDNCNNDAADGCEVNLQNDSNNCGVCGRSCGGGACVAGVCQATTIWSGSFAPAFQANADGLYWTESNKVVKIPLAGGASTTVVTDQDTAANDLVLTSTNIYFTAQSATQRFLKIAPLAGGASSYALNTEVGYPSGYVVEGSAYYLGYTFIPGGGGRITRREGTATTQLLPGNYPSVISLRTFGGYFYWAVSTTNPSANTLVGLERIQRNGNGVTGSAQACASNTLVSPSFTGDATNLYWIDRNVRTVYRASHAGAANCVSTAVGSTPLDEPWYVAVDSQYVYWSGNGLYRAPINGGSVTTLIEPVGTSLRIRYLTVVGSFLYWTEGNTIKRIAK